MTAALSSSAAGLAGWTQRWLKDLPEPAGELAPVQERGRRALTELTPPSSRQEDWRFTDLALLLQLPTASVGTAETATASSAVGEYAPLAPTPGVLRLHLDGRRR